MTIDSVVLRSTAAAALHDGILGAVALHPGDTLDETALSAARVAIDRWLQDHGHLAPHVRVGGKVDSAAYRAFALLEVEPGPLVRLGEVHVNSHAVAEGASRVTEREVREILALRSGTVLGAPSLERARQRLASTDVYDRMEIRVDSLRRPAPSSTISGRPMAGPAVGHSRTTPNGDSTALADVHVDLVDAPANVLQLRVGYGTLDCIRLQTELQRTAFIEPAGHLELSARLSKLAVGTPLRFAPGLCSSAVRADPYSQRLNYFFGSTYRSRALDRAGFDRAITLYTERRSEYLAYLRTTYVGALVAASRALPAGWRGTLGHALSYGRTEAPPAVLCVNFNACLPVDRELLTEARTLGVLSAVLGHNDVDRPLDPSRGHSLRLEVRGSATWLGSNSSSIFIGGRVDGSAYTPLGARLVLATRVRLAAVTSPGESLVPQQERLFAGGSTTIRGYARNEVGPRIYLVDSVSIVAQGADTFFTSNPAIGRSKAVPVGGNALLLGNIELRASPPKLGSYVQLAMFLDAGAVWIRGAESSEADFRFRVTPGVGVRVLTPIGPIRVDVAYNLYAPRPGPAYRDTPFGRTTAPLYCVSPENTLHVTGTRRRDDRGELLSPTQEEGPCPSTFAPRRGRSFFDRLMLHFSIGQAY